MDAPADSATVIVLRDASAASCEVLLVRRHADSRAFAGAHVFPGGRVDDTDAGDAIQARCADLTAAAAVARLGETLAPTAALAFWVAAIRELFEETGILLADADGQPVRFADAGVQARFRAHRAALLAGTCTFAELVARERLALATDRLEYFSRWITPVTAPRRYDARFFVARLPADQEPLHDARETTAADWFTPADALARAQQGALTLTPPTMRTLEDLEALGSRDAIFAAARARRFTAILPKVVEVGGRMTILYPGDAAYEHATPGVPAADDVAGARNRVVLDGGAWRTIRSA
jgi:8-oxo-dGTP pyrophosphatase MutT (NUDIX family)